MASFGPKSLIKLAELDPRLQEVLNEAIKIIDFTIICGHRNKEDQEAAVKGGFSKVHFPNSKHNSLPSKAVDVAVYPIDWDDIKSFSYLAGIIVGIGAMKGYKITWGADWDRDGKTSDEKFIDAPHLEIT